MKALNKTKWIWRAIIGLVVLYAVFSGISRHVHMNRLARDLRYGSAEEKVAAAKELMRRDRLYDKMQEMPKETRIAIMDTIEEIPGELTVKQCLILLKDTEPAVRDRVTKALIKLGKDHISLLVPAMKDSDENVRNGAKAALVGIGPKVIPHVQPAVKPADLRGAACEVLIKLGEPSVPALVDLLDEDDQDVRMAAADALGKIGSRRATPALLKSTRDIAAVRRIAISSLCTICDPRATDLFIEVLTHTRDDGEVRARAARALSVVGGPKAIATLTASLGDYDLKVRTSVITGLQRIGSPAVDAVVAAMSGGSKEVRRAGAEVLEKIDSPEAASALLKLVNDPDPAIRLSVARGLGNQTVSPQIATLISMLSDPDGRVADAAADSLVHTGDRAVPALVAALESGPSDVVRFRAADSLARIGKAAVPALVTKLQAGGNVAKYAAYALGRAGDRNTKPVLERYVSASDPDLAAVVQRALNRM